MILTKSISRFARNTVTLLETVRMLKALEVDVFFEEQNIHTVSADLGDFAPKFAELNDDVLFGEVWSREDRLSARDRSLVTVTALMAQGLTDISFRHHLEI